MKQWERRQNYIGVLLTGFLFAMTMYSIHDMQTAEGVGLYFALKVQQERLFWDLLADVAAGLGLIGLILLPWGMSREKNALSLLQFQCLFLAFMPPLSMAYLIHPAGREWNGESESVRVWLQMLLPLLALLFLAQREKRENLKKRCVRSATAVLICLCSLIFFPYLQELAEFIVTYIFIWNLYDSYKRLESGLQPRGIWRWVLLAGLFLRSIYKLLMLSSQF